MLDDKFWQITENNLWSVVSEAKKKKKKDFIIYIFAQHPLQPWHDLAHYVHCKNSDLTLDFEHGSERDVVIGFYYNSRHGGDSTRARACSLIDQSRTCRSATKTLQHRRRHNDSEVRYKCVAAVFVDLELQDCVAEVFQYALTLSLPLSLCFNCAV